MPSKSFNNGITAVFTNRRVLIQSYDTCLRKELSNLRFYPFRAGTEKLDIFTAALRTAFGNIRYSLTIVTPQVFRLLMVYHRYIAGFTFNDITAFSTHDEGRKSSSI